MGLSDPFSTTYEGSRQALGQYGAALQSVASQYAARQEQKRQEELQMQGEERKYQRELGLEEEKGKIKIGQELSKQKQSQDFISNLLKNLGKKSGEIGMTGFTVDPISGDVKVAYGETPESRQKREIATAATKEKEIRLNKLKELNKAVDFFETKIEEIPGAKGLGGRMKGLGVMVSGMLQTDPKASAYMASMEGLRSQIARGLGEVGNLSEYEQKFAINLIPKVTDNLETRKAKLKNFRDYIKTRSQISNPENILEFNSEEEANKVNLKKGTKIMINGRPAIWE